jgi:hypothetical protein
MCLHRWLLNLHCLNVVFHRWFIFQLPWQNKNNRFGLEVLLLYCWWFCFTSKPFNILKFVCTTQFGVLKQLLFRHVDKYRRTISENTTVFPPPVGNWYKWRCIVYALKDGIDIAFWYAKFFCLRFLFLTCFGTLLIDFLQKYAQKNSLTGIFK